LGSGTPEFEEMKRRDDETVKEETGRTEIFELDHFRGITPQGLNVNSPGWSGAEPGVVNARSSPSAVAFSKENK